MENESYFYFQPIRQIFDAIDQGDPEWLQTVATSTLINRYYRGETPLFYAVSAGSRDDIIEQLCHVEGIDINKGNESGESPLSKAVKLKNRDLIKFFCKNEKVNVDQKDWATAERQNEMFQSKTFYPLMVRIVAGGGNLFDVSNRNRLGDTLAHMAVKSDLPDGIDFLCKLDDINFNARNQDDETAFDIIFPENRDLNTEDFTSILRIACRTNGKDVVARKDSQDRTVLHMAALSKDEKAFLSLHERNKADIDFNAADNMGNTTLSLAIENEMENVAIILLSQPEIKLDIHEKVEKDGFHLLKDILNRLNTTTKNKFDLILENYLSDKAVPEDPPKNTRFSLEKLFENADDEKSVLDEFRMKIADEAGENDVKAIYTALLNITVTGLQQYANHRNLQYVLYKGSVIKTFVQIFVDLGDEKSDDSVYLVQLLRVLYISTQANIKCDCESLTPKNVMTSEPNGTNTQTSNATHVLSRSLAKTLGVELHKKFQEKVVHISDAERNGEVSNSQLIAKGIHNAYFKDEPGIFDSFKKSLAKANDWLSSFLHIRKFFHKCFCRGDFAFIACFMSIFIQSSDIISDALVGVKTLNGFSERLGMFMIALVIVTLVHENIHSVISAYETDQELLRITLGKIELSEKDISENSDLNYFNELNNCVLRTLGRFLWTFKVCDNHGHGKFTIQSIRPLFFNALSILMLRPVADRLIVLSHSPSHLRAIYRQQAKQKSLNQYYMILEQMPELLIQFYVFQIYFNNLRTEKEYKKYECSGINSFTYKIEYFECVQNLLKLKICASWLEIYSMLVPFVKIPDSIVSLEEMFRILSPETPRMSAAPLVCLRVAYTLMIPSRLFLFAAVMHSSPNILYVAAYGGLVSCVWLTINFTTLMFTKKWKENLNEGKGFSNVLKYGKTLWSLMLFTVRDVIVISLRRPEAYLLPPSEVNYKTLRSWKRIFTISSYYFLEGIAGAVIVEHNYPCGRKTEIFKYQGWVYLILLIISITMIALLSYILQPTKINVVPLQFPNRAAIICSFGFVMWLLAAASFIFTTKNKRDQIFLPLVITTLIILFIFLAVVVILRLFSEAKRRQKRAKNLSTEESSKNRNCCLPKRSSNLCCSKNQDSSIAIGQSNGDIRDEDIVRSNQEKGKRFRIPVFLRRGTIYQQVEELESAPTGNEKSGCLCCSNRNSTEDKTGAETVGDQKENIEMSPFLAAVNKIHL